MSAVAPQAPPLLLECQTCGAALAVEAAQRTARCLYCLSPSVIQRPPAPDRPLPTFALGFVVTKERALQIARRWVRTPWLAPEGFRRAAVTEIRGLYLPAYLYSAAVHSTYSASIGENYTVTEHYWATDSKGRRVRRSRRKTKTEWRSLSGAHATYVSDRVVTASRGLANAELEAVEPFDLRALHRFTPKLISGWAAEEPSLSRQECAALARREALDAVGRTLARFMPGNSHRSLQYRSRMEDEDLTLALLPLWVLPVRYAPDKPVVRLLVNGQTGAIHGRPPRAAWKIVLLALLVLAVLAVPLLLLLGGLGAAVVAS